MDTWDESNIGAGQGIGEAEHMQGRAHSGPDSSRKRDDL